MEEPLEAEGENFIDEVLDIAGEVILGPGETKFCYLLGR